MKTISPLEAFGVAAPRRPAVLCVPRPGGTDMITTQWFNWLNMKRQPMLTYAMDRKAPLGADLKPGDELYLAFPSNETALKYREGCRAGGPEPLPEGPEPRSVPGIGALVPAGAEVVLRCTLFGAYNYPFKKTRIFNCNLEKAFALKPGDTRGPLPAAPEEQEARP